jgi:FlaA1/EpsC-like NDP-sugar epimerase
LSTPDLVRWCALALGCFVLGTLAAVYQCAWRFATPVKLTRTIFGCSAALVVFAIIVIHSHIGQRGWSWHSPMAATIFVVYLGALLRAYWWLHTKAGRRRRHGMISDFHAQRLLHEHDAMMRRAAHLASHEEKRQSHSDRAHRRDDEEGEKQ